MTRQDLINSVATKSGATKKQVTDILDVTFDEIMGTLAKGAKVTISGFGTFSVSHRSERRGKNPRTKEEIIIPASKTPHFKAGKSFRESVNQ